MATTKQTASTYTSQPEEDLARELDQQFLLSKRYLDSIHTRMNQQEELYRSFIDKTNYPHGAKVFDPRTFRVIETITPRMVANEPTGSFYPAEEGDVATAHVLNALVKYDWKRAEMFPKLVMFVKSMLIFGTAFGRTYWDFQERDRTRMVAKQLNGRMVWTPKNKETIKVTQFDGPNFEPLNIYDCFPDPNATSLHDMRWFIYRTFKTLEELERENDTRGAEYYKHLDVLREQIENRKKDRGRGSSSATAQDSNLQYREHRRIMLSTQEFHGNDDTNPEFVVLRRFTRDGWCDFIPEYNLVIREVQNPYFHGDLPIVHGVDYPYPGDLYGMGEIEPIDRVQRAINAVLNQRLDNVQLTLRTMWKVQKGQGVDLHTLVSAPGNIVTTNNMNAVEPVQVPDVTGSTFVQTMNYLTSSLQNGSGITDYTMGIDGQNNVANKTATGTRLIQQEANAQFKLKIQLFSHMVIQRIANQWKDLRIQYTTEEQKLRIVGKEDVQQMVNTTNLSQVDLEGNEIAPGMPVKSKMEVSSDGNFAFLQLFPEDIQPTVVGDYDFVATVSQEQLTDQVIMQENFFAATDRLLNPVMVQGLAQQQKMPNYSMIAEKTYDQLHIGIEGKDLVTDMAPPPQVDPMTGQPVPPADQPLGHDQINQMLEPMQNPLVNPADPQVQAQQAAMAQQQPPTQSTGNAYGRQ